MPPKTDQAELLQGTLDMLILKSLAEGPRHGYGVARWIHTISRDALRIEEGSLYPALHRMARRGWIAASWGQSEANRRAKFYRLTRSGRRQLGAKVGSWQQLVAAIALVLEANPVEAVR